MRVAYFDCFSGISGDMTLGAFLGAGLSFRALTDELAKLKIKGYRLKKTKVSRGSIAGTKFECVATDGRHSRSLGEILSIIEKSGLRREVKDTSARIFGSIGAAEAKVHGFKSSNDIRLHELGSIDSIVDVVGAAIAVDELAIDEVYASSITTGRGSVRTAHGLLPVPAPAVAELLRGVPVNIGTSPEELVTPTGAGIIKTLAKGFGAPPSIKPEAVGYGAGSRDDKAGLPNVLRIIVGETVEGFEKDSVCVIETNIDDMNPQNFGYIFERLFKEGALDAYLENIYMKKSRPGFKLTVIAAPRDRDKMAGVIFQETTTIGLRFYNTARLKLERETANVITKGGRVKVKISKGPGGALTTSPEYEECAVLARKNNIPLKVIMDEARVAVKL